jgi:hypothetical protein
MAWLGLTPFRFDRTQDRGNGKNLCRHHPSIGDGDPAPSMEWHRTSYVTW